MNNCSIHYVYIRSNIDYIRYNVSHDVPVYSFSFQSVLILPTQRVHNRQTTAVEVAAAYNGAHSYLLTYLRLNLDRKHNKLEWHSDKRSCDGSVNKTILKPRLALAARRQWDFPGKIAIRYRRNQSCSGIRTMIRIGLKSQGLISSSMSRHLSTGNISSKSVHAFLSNIANRQTNKQTNTGKTCTSSFVGGKLMEKNFKKRLDRANLEAVVEPVKGSLTAQWQIFALSATRGKDFN